MITPMQIWDSTLLARACERRGCSLVARKASGWEVQDVKPSCEPSSGIARIESPSDSEKLTLLCGAQYRLAGTHLLGWSGEKTQKAHLPFSKSAWRFNMCPGRLFCPNTSAQNRGHLHLRVVVALPGSFSSPAGSQALVLSAVCMSS